MLQTCPACHSENRDTAKFCDQCAAPLSPAMERSAPLSPVPSAGAALTQRAPVVRPPGSINWNALLVIAAIVLGIVWVIKTPSTQQSPPPMAGSAAPGDNPIGTMENVQKQLTDLKAKLKKDPVDAASLHDLYMMYSQIGQTEKVQPYIDKALSRWQQKLKKDPLDIAALNDFYLIARLVQKIDAVKPYADSALAAWKKKYPKPDGDALSLLARMALPAIQVADDDFAARALIAYHEADPTNLGVVATLGNLYYNIDQPQEAIKWYGMYLDQATPKEQGGDYWNILVDKATMHLHLAGQDASSADYKQALELLTRATKEAPEHWAAWFNLGQAHKVAQQKEQALAAFNKSLENATDEQAKYESQRELNLLEGKPAPEPPVNPHGEMDMSPGSGVSLPKPPPGTPNPHTEGGGGM